MEGKINFTACQDTTGKKPHYKGYITIAEQVHEFAVWPAKTGNGWSGSYKPKGQKYVTPATQETLSDKIQKAIPVNIYNDEIPF